MARNTTRSAAGVATSPRSRSEPQTYWERVRVLAGKRWRPFVVFIVLMQAFDALRITSVVPLDDPRYLPFAFGILAYPVTGFPLFIALVMSEALGLRGIRHALASLAAVGIALALAFGSMLWMETGILRNYRTVAKDLVVSDAAFIGRQAWFCLAGGMLLVAYLSFREQEAASLRLAQDAATERTRTERATMAAKLKVLQAQVEPALLFGVLADVRELYLRAPVEADALLDDLIAYLRAALPQMRGEASTLAQEAALAVAYVKVLPKGRRGEIVAESTLDRTAADVPFPPMVLLPLVQSAAEAPISRVTLSLDTQTLNGVCVAVDCTPALSIWDDERLAPLRSTLNYYFGPDAGIDVAGTQVTVHWG